MSVRYFHLKNSENKYLNVQFNGNNQNGARKEDYVIYYSEHPASIWYTDADSKNTSVINLKDSYACYKAYEIEYDGHISLSYNPNSWKTTDGLSTCCLTIESNNTIINPTNRNMVLYVIPC